MDHHVNDFYQASSEETRRGNFHEVIVLNEAPALTWEKAHQKAATLPKGWFELSHLKPEDRIEFTKDFWSAKLAFQPKLTDFLSKFFASLDDIGIFLVQKKFDDPFEPHLIYSIKSNGGFFKGLVPATEQSIVKLKNSFPNIIFPEDYIGFLQIHDGFSKTSDTGIIPSGNLAKQYACFQQMIKGQDPLTTGNKEQVDPKSLIPFYQSFGMPFLQCFWGEWYPENEMGNVYYSGLTKTISTVKCRDPGMENMAFPSFADWLMFYMETFD